MFKVVSFIGLWEEGEVWIILGWKLEIYLFKVNGIKLKI